jgi:hypothetical protein
MKGKRVSGKAEAYAALYAEIPAFQCKEGCNECCGPMPAFSEWEWEQVPEKRRCITMACPYKTEAGCAIYEHRAFICRLFGNVEGFTCIHGFGPKPNRLLTIEQGKDLKRRYYELED